MRVSWNWLSEMVDLSPLEGPEGLADLLTRRGIEVEAIHRLDAGFESVVTAELRSRERHPDADRLSVCQVVVPGEEPLQIVCGASNMKAGDVVALARVGAKLPNGMKIEMSKIRGVVSHGMLCSEEELKLRDKSEGILILPAGTPAGKPLASILGRDDAVLELAVTPNRGDCLSHWGIAREVSAALGRPARRPVAPDVALEGSPIGTSLAAGEEGPQFYGCLIEGVKIGPSPDWVVRRLEAIAQRSINNVVDATNLVLFELGQPTHAYDADRITSRELAIRKAKKGEALALLDGKSIALDGSELVIADGPRAVGLAGVMGGSETEVSDGTKRVFLEVAEFAPLLVRKAGARHQKLTEAKKRFERGIDPEGLHAALSRLAALVIELAGGRIAGGVASVHASRSPFKTRQIPVMPGFFPGFLGFDITADKARALLEGLGCRVDGTWTVRVPSWRPDLAIREDLAEEIARTIGYEHIPSTIPVLTGAPSARSGDARAVRLHQIDAAKDALARLGLRETVSYSFTGRAWLEQFGMTSAVAVTNPLSEEQEVMVPSLLPGLVKAALDNWHRHFGSEPLPIRLFELRPTFTVSKKQGKVEAATDSETGVEEGWKLSLLVSGPRLGSALRAEQGEWDFFDLKGVLGGALESLGVRGVRYAPLADGCPALKPLFHPGLSVEVWAGKDCVGVMGSIHPGLARRLKLRATVWAAELDWNALSKLARTPLDPPSFKAWSEYPTIERDFALVVKDGTPAERITQLAMKAGKPLAKVVKVFDIYRGSQVAQGMTSIAVRVIFSNDERSLQESEADQCSDQILRTWKQELGAELRG